MRRRLLSVAIATLAIALVAAGPSVVVSGQLLAYQEGYVFFTTGDGFRVAHDIVIRDAKTGAATPIHPAPRIWARATFDSTGTVTELDLSRDPLPPQGSSTTLRDSRSRSRRRSPIPICSLTRKRPHRANPKPLRCNIFRAGQCS